jgi:hypothetical protein
LIKIIHENFIGGSALIKEAYEFYFIGRNSGYTCEIMSQALDFMNCRLTTFGIGIMSQWVGTRNGQSGNAFIITQIRPRLR